MKAAGAWVSSTQVSPPTVKLELLFIVLLLLLFNLFQYCIEKGSPFTQYKLNYFNIFVLDTNELPTGFIPE